MSVVHGHVLGHLVRRGVDAAQAHFQVSPETMAKLQHDAELYEKTGAEIHDWEMLPVAFTALITILVLVSVCFRKLGASGSKDLVLARALIREVPGRWLLPTFLERTCLRSLSR